MDASQDFAAAVSPWSFADPSGRRYEARPVGWMEALRWIHWFEWAGEDPFAQQKTADRVIRRLFPLNLRAWFRVARGREKDPRSVFRRLPGPVQMALLTDFFARAGLRLRPVPPTPPTRSSSNSSNSNGIRSRLTPSVP